MSDKSTKRSIPSWQRAALSPDAPKQEAGSDAPGPEEAAAGPGTTSDETDSADSPPPESSDTQLDMVDAFLADPKVKDEPIEKKRAFLQSKEIPVETIDHVLKPDNNPTTPTFDTTDFRAFKQQQQQQQRPPLQPPPQPATTTTTTAPPIITYPEFLLSGHKPSPLVTPTRLLNAAYLAGGLATLIYGASTFIFRPLTDTLTAARHDFALHSQGKLDELNDRLGKLVSKVPPPPPTGTESKPETEVDMMMANENKTDDSSTSDSDPTELYHRDMGTQTTPLPSIHQPSSDPFIPAASTSPHPTSTRATDPTTYQTTGLTILSTHLSELLTGLTTPQAAANKDRAAEARRLRHCVDGMLYGGGAWSSSQLGGGEERWRGEGVYGNSGKREGEGEGQAGGLEKTVEELKREIRGVKGVLLSARRFPGVGGGGKVGLGVGS
ncbi:hypothetical protein B0A55_09660 [Friedmanniomyces simplex]|uniref:Peroxisome membrane anchor protein Pex14p N-terminal domain-containing protein n=1 Tax=Friedmanniomyces simplex TaxID=329884 RepID=A0A4U0WW73_9PEZI|nr:hypothetical protein B0A55_09660 [Friedmanniomyces simplex]